MHAMSRIDNRDRMKLLMERREAYSNFVDGNNRITLASIASGQCRQQQLGGTLFLPCALLRLSDAVRRKDAPWVNRRVEDHGVLQVSAVESR